MPRYIDADALMEQMINACMGVMSGSEPFNKPLKVLESAPTADVVERKRGKWIKHKDRDCWYCSECKKDNYYAYCWNSDTGKYEIQDHFCPNCGADMRGEEDGET